MLLLNRNQSSDCFLIQMNDFYMIGNFSKYDRAKLNKCKECNSIRIMFCKLAFLSPVLNWSQNTDFVPMIYKRLPV